jgi:carbon-monoxide dehydrogenase medium subunit
MIPSSFDYVAPGSVAEATKLLAGNPDAKILAGGQSLIPMMRFRLASPVLLVDINRVSGLDYIREEGGWLKIGAMTREATIDHSAVVHKSYPLLADTAKVIADPLVRNMATVGGNLAHADPANDHPATMLAYGAEVVATGAKGERVISINDFFSGPFESSLAHDELLTEIRIPAHKAHSGGAYFKMERKVGDFATAAVAVQLTLDDSGKCTYVGIGLTNVGLTPIKATAAEAALMGKVVDAAAIKAVVQLAADVAEPEADRRGSDEYKRALVRTLMGRALRKALERAKGA